MAGQARCEGNGVIPAEAVEAAAKRYYEASNYGQQWKLLGNSDQAIYRHRIQMALEAAAPYMLAAAWQKGRSAGQMDPYDRYPAKNPYRSEQ